MSVLFKYCRCPKKIMFIKISAYFSWIGNLFLIKILRSKSVSVSVKKPHSIFFSNTVTTNYLSYFLPLQSVKQVSPAAVKGMVFSFLFVFLYASSCMQNPQSAIRMWTLILWLEAQPSIQAVSSKPRRWGDTGGLNRHGYSHPLWTVIFCISVGSGKKAPPRCVTSDYREDSHKLRPPLCWLLIRPGACSASLLCCGF